jgi:F-type H+-transporting ATPase subunit delta
MKDRKLASRYARALLASLPDGGAAEQADRFLTAIREALEESVEFRDLLFDPAVSRSTREQVLRTLADRSEMPVQVANFLATIVDHNRTTSLASIAEVFHEEREAAAGIVPAEITTAMPLSDDLKQRTLQALEQMTGRKVRLTANLDPAILGGAVTKVGSTVYDGSLKTQLDQLRRKMTQE